MDPAYNCSAKTLRLSECLCHPQLVNCAEAATRAESLIVTYPGCCFVSKESAPPTILSWGLKNASQEVNLGSEKLREVSFLSQFSAWLHLSHA